jgi:creatinine amidohydrolase
MDAMPLFELAHLTWEVIGGIDRERAVVILPLGAIEAHGPHLPLATDVIIAEAMARVGAERLSARGMDVLLLPTLAYAPAPFAADFPGTLSFSPDAITELVAGLAESLGRHDFDLMALANGHLDPTHLGGIRAGVAAAHRDTQVRVVFPDVTQRPWASRLTAEFKSGACHAGRYETSIIMALQPDLVLEEVRRRLPPNARSLSSAIEAGQKSFVEAGGPRAYFGYPGEATAKEGRNTVALLGGILEEAVMIELARSAG